jgi:hypothetical protein
VTFLFPPVETKFEIAPEHFGSLVAAPKQISLDCGVACKAAEYHSERSLPTVIGIVVNATFVDERWRLLSPAMRHQTFGRWWEPVIGKINYMIVFLNYAIDRQSCALTRGKGAVSLSLPP